MLKTIFFILTISAAPIESESARPSVSVNIRMDHSLIVDIGVRNIFTQKIIEGLKSGLTSRVEYTVELWWERPRWFNQLMESRKFGAVINYDIWREHYKIKDLYGELHTVSDFNELRKKVCKQKRITEFSKERLIPGKTYYIVVRFSLKPIVIENINELGGYLSGEVKKAKENKKTLFLHIVNQAKNLAGLGERVVTGESKKFSSF